MMMKFLLALPVLLASLALPAGAQELSLKQISDYLNSLTSAAADFTQINDDGTISSGQLFIKRPGRVRFEYAKPDKALVLASAQTVAIFDAKSNQPPEQYPLKKTPLSLILDRNVDLSRRNMVVGKSSDDTTTTVIAQDPEHPDYGTIRLIFTANPVELRKWIITDQAGSETTVVLGGLTPQGDLADSLFDIQREIERRG